MLTTVVSLPANQWRGLARFAASYVRGQTNNLFLAYSSIVALHSIKAEPQAIKMPTWRRVFDGVSNSTVSEKMAQVGFDFKPPATGFFRIENP
ncbi:MAG: hypothetical protein KGZ25_03830 [Planctomycetes bacterium]|nr:hypothetical protein [Planctomycetota bacterium]